MSRIKNWKLIDKTAWQNKISGRVVTLHHEPDWEEPWLVELHKNYQLFGKVVIGKNTIDTIGYYSKKSLALSGAVGWMRRHLKG